jgi:hypothetical protein
MPQNITRGCNRAETGVTQQFSKRCSNIAATARTTAKLTAQQIYYINTVNITQ